MISATSFEITKERYNYMLPIYGIEGMLGDRMLRRVERGIEKFFFIGTKSEYEDFLNRCKYL